MIAQQFRSLAKRPGWSALVVLTLGLAIGASTAVFSVVDAVVLRSQPYPQPDGLLSISRVQPPISSGPISRPDFLELTAGNDADLTVAGMHWDTIALTGREGPAERLAGARVTPEYFGVFRSAPALGRWLGAVDDAPDATPAAVISDRLWRNRFGADPAVLGRVVSFNGVQRTIVGVTGPEFDHPRGGDVWIPMQLGEIDRDRDSNFIQLIARKGDAFPLAQVEARLGVLTARWRKEFPKTATNLELHARTLHEVRVGGVRSGLFMLLGAVGLVLLIACANVTNMLLARTFGRRREYATRAALGASLWRLAGEALSESLLLAFAGALVGVVLARIGIDVLIALAPAGLPRIGTVSIDGAALAFALGAAALTGTLAGLMPAAVARRTALAEALRAGGKQGSGGARQGWRRALVAGELATSVVLLVGAALLIVSLARLSTVDPGFRTDHLLTGMVTMPRVDAALEGEARADAQRAADARFLDAVQQRVRALPGVVAVGAIDALPVSGNGNWNGGIQIGGRDPYPDGQNPVVEMRFVTPEYFGALGLPLQAGALMRPGGEGAFPIVVNQALVDRLFPDVDPLGQTLKVADGDFHTIVGVVASARQWGLDSAPDPEVYIAVADIHGPGEATLVLRTTVDPATLAGPLREAIAAVDPSAPLFEVRTMDEVLAASMAQRRFTMTLLIVFAAAALLIAAAGLYGVMSYTVELATHDIGVRMALGARRGQVLRGTLGDGLATAALGVGLGLIAALGASSLLASLVFGVSARDPLVYGVVGATLLAVAAAACALPAWRAASIEPTQALRYE
jgi:putative ABC transport system permease protein